jgi:Flp pilus assembly protein CpaB
VARVSPRGVAVELTAAEAASARICVLRGAHTLSSARRVMAGRSPGNATCATAAVAQNRRSRVLLARPVGSLTLAVRLVAETNPARSTTVVRRLR